MLQRCVVEVDANIHGAKQIPDYFLIKSLLLGSISNQFRGIRRNIKHNLETTSIMGVKLRKHKLLFISNGMVSFI